MGSVLVGVVWFAVTALQGDPFVPVGLKNRDPKAFQVALTKIQQAQITRVRGDNEIYVANQDRALVEARLAESGVLDPQQLDMESAIGDAARSNRMRATAPACWWPLTTGSPTSCPTLTIVSRRSGDCPAQPPWAGTQYIGANRFRSVAFPVWRSFRRVGYQRRLVWLLVRFRVWCWDRPRDRCRQWHAGASRTPSRSGSAAQRWPSRLKIDTRPTFEISSVIFLGSRSLFG